jgi:hypothetical protein
MSAKSIHWPLIATLTLLAPCLDAFARQHAKPPKQTITLKLVSGNTGHSVWWLGKAAVRIGSAIKPGDQGWLPITTNLVGEAKVDVTNADPAQLEAEVNYITRDCRYSSTSQSQPVMYSIDEIRTRGIVSDNYCGGPKQAPKPGVLVVYVIPMTLRELWNL